MLPDSSPATELFPQFQGQIYDMVVSEVAGLTDAELDFESDRWEWSKWSIRRNLSHLASGDLRWLWSRWGKQLFPEGLPNGEELDALLESPHDRRLNESKYWEPEVILAKLRQGLDLCCLVLSAETVGSLQSKETETPSDAMWALNPEIFRSGIRKDPGDSSRVYMSLEATFLHRYYEYIAHLNNIQRLKKAQGLEPATEIPFEGYWALPDWDRSEP